MRMARLGSLIITIVLSLFAVVSFFPLYVTVLNSFKTEKEIFGSILSLPTAMHIENYTDALQKTQLLSSLGNTVIVSVLGIAGILLFASLAGYKLSRTPGKLSNLIFFLFISSMLVPFHSIMIPLVKTAKSLLLQGSIYGLAVIYIGLGVNMAIFLYHGFVKSIPRELEESAYMDGCGQFRTFTTIILPLLLPITVTAGILNFLSIWNDFLLPLLMIQDAKDYTLMLSTNKLFGEYTKDWSLILAALVLTAIPVIIIYAIFQKFIVSGIAEGAVKG
ncbi:carbohydrate ABC transporter permease [Paenibacillus periandrae]|uniref:carbohydrate ABC transporter permease n=1 Tax=Paenibacillus periandrae TaxID=1761741 RepID=UPI001F08D294|nr:carbohydrate ABC transporter permease [Paenibacillus periandrae]